MSSISRQHLSGSTNGLPIPVAATATPGTTIHTAVSGTTSFDEIYLWAANVTATAATLTLEWGGTTDPGNHLVKGYSIPANSASFIVASGQVLNNANVVKAFSGSGVDSVSNDGTTVTVTISGGSSTTYVDESNAAALHALCGGM